MNSAHTRRINTRRETTADVARRIAADYGLDSEQSRGLALAVVSAEAEEFVAGDESSMEYIAALQDVERDIISRL